MRRALVPLFALGALLNGCVIYETERVRGECWDDDCAHEGPRDDEDPATSDPSEDPATSDPGEDPVEPEPEPQIEMWLSVATGAQGDSLLTWLETDAAFDFTNIADIVFVGDVTLVEKVVRTDEAFLLLEIPADAKPGVVQVFVEFTDGSAVLIPGGFTVVEGASGDGGTGTGTGTTPCDCTC